MIGFGGILNIALETRCITIFVQIFFKSTVLTFPSELELLELLALLLGGGGWGD